MSCTLALLNPLKMEAPLTEVAGVAYGQGYRALFTAEYLYRGAVSKFSLQTLDDFSLLIPQIR